MNVEGRVEEFILKSEVMLEEELNERGMILMINRRIKLVYEGETKGILQARITDKTKYPSWEWRWKKIGTFTKDGDKYYLINKNERVVIDNDCAFAQRKNDYGEYETQRGIKISINRNISKD